MANVVLVYVLLSSVEKKGLYVKITLNLELIFYRFMLRSYRISGFYSSIPSSGDLWNMYVNIESSRLDLRESLVPVFTYNRNTSVFEMIVPTTETVRVHFIMERLLAVNYPLLLTGLTGKKASFLCLVGIACSIPPSDTKVVYI